MLLSTKITTLWLKLTVSQKSCDLVSPVYRFDCKPLSLSLLRTHTHSYTHADTQLDIANRIFPPFLWRLKGSFLRLTGTLITPFCVGLVQISTQCHCDVRFFHTGSLHRCCVCSVLCLCLCYYSQGWR